MMMIYVCVCVHLCIIWLEPVQLKSQVSGFELILAAVILLVQNSSSVAP